VGWKRTIALASAAGMILSTAANAISCPDGCEFGKRLSVITSHHHKVSLSHHDQVPPASHHHREVQPSSRDHARAVGHAHSERSRPACSQLSPIENCCVDGAGTHALAASSEASSPGKSLVALAPAEFVFATTVSSSRPDVHPKPPPPRQFDPALLPLRI